MSEKQEKVIKNSVINWDIGIYRQLTSNSYKIRKVSKKVFTHF